MRADGYRAQRAPPRANDDTTSAAAAALLLSASLGPLCFRCAHTLSLALCHAVCTVRSHLHLHASSPRAGRRRGEREHSGPGRWHSVGRRAGGRRENTHAAITHRGAPRAQPAAALNDRAKRRTRVVRTNHTTTKLASTQREKLQMCMESDVHRWNCERRQKSRAFLRAAMASCACVSLVHVGHLRGERDRLEHPFEAAGALPLGGEEIEN